MENEEDVRRRGEERERKMGTLTFPRLSRKFRQHQPGAKERIVKVQGVKRSAESEPDRG